MTLLALVSCFTSGGYGQSQTFSSGSTGADGALNITAPGVTYFNPAALNLNPAIPNIFNFTTINIATGSTLRLSEEIFHGPVFWLASGAVTINGTIDLSGQNGAAGSINQSDRIPAYGGSGGYNGGIGGYGVAASPNLPTAEPGNGPGGGIAACVGCGRGGDATFTGTQYLVPLIGGSGGGGANSSSTSVVAGGGGAGGGAILIASSASITLNASINANGGGGGNSPCNAQACGGGGSGGAIRLMAPVINLGSGGTASANGGAGSINSGTPGRIRFETFQINNPAGNGIGSPFSQSVPFAIALPATAPGSLTVTSIAGTPINANPFSFPDTNLSTSGSVVINIQAQYIPPGTVPTLTVFSETGPDQIIACSPLSGTLQQSTSTATVTFPTGGSRGFVKAAWSH